MGAWLERHFSWHGETSRDEYRRWLPLVIPVEILLLAGLWFYGHNGTIHFPSTLSGVSLLAVGFAYRIALFFLTARRFRSAGLSRGWLFIPFFTINIPVGSHFWSVGATITLLTILAGATVEDLREEERIY
ncbi:hypothetical protein [Sphingopyxis sp.]|uniref:hypothetical protein n=1 Tax=Sphingopyxis sp. TaxID=1908224 RepID=UPI003D6D2D40